MNEFTKQKITFAVAFLAALFSISPMLNEFGVYGFELFGQMLTIKYLYYIVASVFTLSVYSFGIQFITEKGFSVASKIGNTLYALAIIAPLIYLITAIAVAITNHFSKHFASIPVNLITGISGVLIGTVASRVAYTFQSLLAEREKNATTQQLEKEESLFMKRSQDLMRSKQYDLSVVEAFKAIEVSAKKALYERGIYFNKNRWVSEISKNEMLSGELIKGLEYIRQTRNIAAHGVEPIRAEVAKEIMPIASRIVASLSAQQSTT